MYQVLYTLNAPQILGSVSNSCLRAINSLIATLRKEQDSLHESAQNNLDLDKEILKLNKRISELEEENEEVNLQSKATNFTSRPASRFTTQKS